MFNSAFRDAIKEDIRNLNENYVGSRNKGHTDFRCWPETGSFHRLASIKNVFAYKNHHHVKCSNVLSSQLVGLWDTNIKTNSLLEALKL